MPVVNLFWISRCLSILQWFPVGLSHQWCRRTDHSRHRYYHPYTPVLPTASLQKHPEHQVGTLEHPYRVFCLFHSKISRFYWNLGSKYWLFLQGHSSDRINVERLWALTCAGHRLGLFQDGSQTVVVLYWIPYRQGLFEFH